MIVHAYICLYLCISLWATANSSIYLSIRPSISPLSVYSHPQIYPSIHSPSALLSPLSKLSVPTFYLIFLSVRPSARLPAVYRPVSSLHYTSVLAPVHPSVHLSITRCIHPSIRPSAITLLFLHLPSHLLAYLLACLPAYTPIVWIRPAFNRLFLTRF